MALKLIVDGFMVYILYMYVVKEAINWKYVPSTIYMLGNWKGGDGKKVDT